MLRSAIHSSAVRPLVASYRSACARRLHAVVADHRVGQPQTMSADWIAGLEPAALWHFFKDLTQIPRPSKHEAKCVWNLRRNPNTTQSFPAGRARGQTQSVPQWQLYVWKLLPHGVGTPITLLVPRTQHTHTPFSTLSARLNTSGARHTVQPTADVNCWGAPIPAPTCNAYTGKIYSTC